MVVECDFFSHQEKGDLRQIQQEKEEGEICTLKPPDREKRESSDARRPHHDESNLKRDEIPSRVGVQV
jgi:hypothetical protein